MKGENMSNEGLRGRVHQIPQIDETLTKEGYGADAKATGAKFAEISSRIDKMSKSQSYVGNGDATTRTINIGGTGAWLGICSGSYIVGIITQNGAVCFGTTDGSVHCFPVSKAKYMSGVLTISSDDAYLNGSGYTYHYQVL